MPRLEGFKRNVDVLGKLMTEVPKKYEANMEVGYSAPYALYVHEDLVKVHPQGQAKFLEQSARTMSDELSNLIATAVESGKTMRGALELAGGALLLASQELVPVETGALKASGYVKVD